MEFEAAAQRLARDQSKLANKRRDNRILSQKAKRQADIRKKQQEQMKNERLRKQQQEEFIQSYMKSCERALGIQSLGQQDAAFFEATSIYGNGDKIALPPSVLQHLTQQQSTTTNASPWTFRVGILNKDYTFPASSLLQTMTSPPEDEDDDTMEIDSDDDDKDDTNDKAAYLDELSHKYLSYTYASVVEFTQEEGHIGLPASIAARLLVDGVSATRTMDPAASSTTKQESDTNTNTDMDMHDNDIDDDDEEKTPGHLAWGAFDVPSLPIQVSLVKLPQGRKCTVIPTMEAIRNGFHTLDNVKLVLEQSLIRTRATLSVGDVVATWHRGTKFDLQVTSVTPSDYQAIRIINTDLEVDIGVNEEFEQEVNNKQAQVKSVDKEAATKKASVFDTSKGHVLSGPSISRTMTESEKPVALQPVDNLLPEPPLDQMEGVCTVQLRGDGASGRRRFDVNTATLKDLFDYAATLSNDGSAFQLVTRFPRRVFSASESSSQTLADAGIAPGQEMFMLEKL